MYDDVHLGFCFGKLGIGLTHSDRFHQGRPEEYVEELLEENDPISFHHFDSTDPRKTYEKWFKRADDELAAYKERHKELWKRLTIGKLQLLNLDISRWSPREFYFEKLESTKYVL